MLVRYLSLCLLLCTNASGDVDIMLNPMVYVVFYDGYGDSILATTDKDQNRVLSVYCGGKNYLGRILDTAKKKTSF